jgi:hypothetical protein
MEQEMIDDEAPVDQADSEDGSLAQAAAEIAALMEDDKKEPEATAEKPEAAEAVAASEPPPAAAQPGPEALQAVTLQQQAQALQAMQAQLQAGMAGEFADLRNVEDVQRLAQTDPPRFNRFMFAQIKLQQGQQASQMALARAAEVQQAQVAAWRSAEKDRLEEALPELKGPQAREFSDRIRQFALQAGYSEQDLARANARDVVTLYRAMRLSDIEAAQETAREKARAAPKVQLPGTRGANAPDKFRSDLERLQKSGRVDDAAQVFQSLLSR